MDRLQCLQSSFLLAIDNRTPSPSMNHFANHNSLLEIAIPIDFFRVFLAVLLTCFLFLQDCLTRWLTMDEQAHNEGLTPMDEQTPNLCHNLISEPSVKNLSLENGDVWKECLTPMDERAHNLGHNLISEPSVKNLSLENGDECKLIPEPSVKNLSLENADECKIISESYVNLSVELQPSSRVRQTWASRRLAAVDLQFTAMPTKKPLRPLILSTKNKLSEQPIPSRKKPSVKNLSLENGDECKMISEPSINLSVELQPSSRVRQTWASRRLAAVDHQLTAMPTKKPLRPLLLSTKNKLSKRPIPS